MGTRSIGIMGPGGRGRRSSFRRIFVWYCVGIVGVTVIASGAIEFALLVGYEFARRGAPATSNAALAVRMQWAAFSIPLVVLIGTILVFAWRMGRNVSLPVHELMVAVEKIRQHDLDFTITYSAHNELGALCLAFNALRRELQESLEREWRKQEEMRMMVAALSHDLRTPVTIIQGHIEGLARAESREKRNQRLDRYLPVLEASSQRMARLLNDILLIATLEQTSFVIQPRPVQVEEELARKARVYSLQAATAGVSFVHHFQIQTPESSLVTLDFDRIEQVLDNLFENAMRHTPTNGEICLTCIRNPCSLTFVLRDSGSGVAPEDLPHVWEKFYRGQTSPVSADGAAERHTGLGLPICKLLVERHGGTITLQNHPDCGCEVTLRIPMPSD